MSVLQDALETSAALDRLGDNPLTGFPEWEDLFDSQIALAERIVANGADWIPADELEAVCDALDALQVTFLKLLLDLKEREQVWRSENRERHLFGQGVSELRTEKLAVETAKTTVDKAKDRLERRVKKANIARNEALRQEALERQKAGIVGNGVIISRLTILEEKLDQVLSLLDAHPNI